MDVDDRTEFSIVVLGEMGNGKSQFCEAVANLASVKGKFHPSSGHDAHTLAVESCTLSLFGSTFRIYDTPGLNDIGDRDEEHMRVMVRELRKLDNVGLIVICLKAMNFRLSNSIVATV